MQVLTDVQWAAATRYDKRANSYAASAAIAASLDWIASLA